MPRYAIVGGGLSGLSAAFYLKQRIPNSQINVIERSNRFGGWIETHSSSNSYFELGPRSARVVSPTSPFLFDLVEKINLKDFLIPVTSTAPATKNRFVYAHKQLHRLNPKLFKSSPPFSQSLFPVLFSSLWRDKKLTRIAENDMSVDEYFRLHFNDEVADIAINSMIRGIFAGDSKALGMHSVFPHIIKIQRQNNGLIRGMLKHSFLSKDDCAIGSSLYKKAMNEKWSIWGVNGGMERIITHLIEELKDLNVSLKLNYDCTDIKFYENNELECKFDSVNGKDSLKCDHVFLAAPLHVCGNILTEQKLFQTFPGVPYVDVAVIGLEYSHNCLPVEGFGHLIPSWEIPHVLGVVYDSCIYPSKEESKVKLTCMIGGAWYQKYCAGMVESDFLKLAEETVNTQLGIKVQPCNSYVRIHRQCIPQYPVGHQSNVRKVRQEILDKKLPVSLIGSAFDGVSVSDCVASAFKAVHDIQM